jgi:copper resistance protein D
VLHALSVWIHVLAAAVWLGGAAFLAFVAVPVLRRHAREPGLYLELLEASVLRFRTVAWIALALVVATGVLQVANHGLTAIFSGRIGAVLGIKIALAALVLVLSAVHDFAIGPRALAAMREDPEGPEAARLRARAGLLGRVSFLLGVVIVGLGTALFRFPF